jgi:ketosteroid isomerase-like protein
MSEENVEIVRAAFTAYNRGDLAAMMEACDPEVEFVMLLQGTRHGREALRLIYEENRSIMSSYRLDPEELIDVDDKVIAVARVGGAGRVSQIALDDEIALMFTFKGGLVIRQQTFRNKQEALEAAGLRE